MPIETPAVSATAGATSLYTGATPSKAKGELDNQAFMNLLVTQLKYQDPSSPMDTTQMMAQTTQLTTVEKLTTLSDTMVDAFALQMRSSAAQFVGLDVSYTNAEGASVVGRATSATFAGGVPKLTVDGVEVSLEAVTGVVAATAQKPSGSTDKSGETPDQAPAPAVPTDPTA